jgi:hypothetical protein
MAKTNAVTQAAKNQAYFVLARKLTKYIANTRMKYENENREK